MIERKKLSKNLQDIAEDLDRLHKAVNQVKIAGGVARLAGFGMMLSGAILEVISEGLANPLVAAVEEGGLALVVGGDVSSTAADVWEQIEADASVKAANKNLQDDDRLCEELRDKREQLNQQVLARKAIYRAKFPSLAIVPDAKLFGLGLLNAMGVEFENMTNLELPLKPVFMEALSILEAVSLEVLMKTLFNVTIAVGLAFTVADLIKDIAELSKGSPSEMATKLRHIADKMEKGLKDLEKFQEEFL